MYTFLCEIGYLYPSVFLEMVIIFYIFVSLNEYE